MIFLLKKNQLYVQIVSKIFCENRNCKLYKILYIFHYFFNPHTHTQFMNPIIER